MRKFTIILIVLFALTIKTNAQIPNSGFENWTTVNGYDSLSGWGSLNYLSKGSFYAVTKSIDHYPTTVGAYSVRIENNKALLSNYSGVGCINTGGFGPKHPVFPITGHPTNLTGYYKFTPQNGDTMGIVIRLYLNGVQVTHNELTSTVSESNWTSFNISIDSYTSADSAFISISPSNFDGNVEKIHGNSVMYVDNLNFDNLITSISEQTSENTAFSLYPNPASDIVTLNIDNRNDADLTMYVYNVIGTLVKSETLKQNTRQINIGDLSNGVYVVSIKINDRTENKRLIIQR